MPQIPEEKLPEKPGPIQRPEAPLAEEIRGKKPEQEIDAMYSAQEDVTGLYAGKQGKPNLPEPSAVHKTQETVEFEELEKMLDYFEGILQEISFSMKDIMMLWIKIGLKQMVEAVKAKIASVEIGVKSANLGKQATEEQAKALRADAINAAVSAASSLVSFIATTATVFNTAYKDQKPTGTSEGTAKPPAGEEVTEVALEKPGSSQKGEEVEVALEKKVPEKGEEAAGAGERAQETRKRLTPRQAEGILQAISALSKTIDGVSNTFTNFKKSGYKMDEALKRQLAEILQALTKATDTDSDRGKEMSQAFKDASKTYTGILAEVRNSTEKISRPSGGV